MPFITLYLINMGSTNMSNKINIFQAAKSSGGVGIYTRRLVTALNKERFQVTVACLAEGSDEMAEELGKLENVRALSIPMKDQIDPFLDIKVCYKLARELRNNKFDIIHAHTSKPGFFARLAAIGTDIPVIYQPANFAFHDGTSRTQANFYAMLERFSARYLTERIIAVCDGERELARRYSVGHDGLFSTIHTGIDLAPFDIQVDRAAVRSTLNIPPEVFLFGTVARLTEAKSPADFIRAVEIVHSQYPKAHFLWVGNGHLEVEARTLVSLLNLGDVFHFSGYRNDIPSILASLDCFVLSSHWEGFSLAVLEAMAAGLPVISTRVMGADEAICNNETGLLVPIGDIEAMSQAMGRLIKNPTLARVFGAAARKRAATEFQYSRTVARIEQLYEEIYLARH